MPSNNRQYKPPKDWQEFERFCHTLWGEILNDPNIQLNGRGGQEQHGVDVYGYSSEGIFTCIQCKGKDANYGSAVTEKELRSEVEKAKDFKPTPKVFIHATTAPNDAKIQEVAREIEEGNKKLGLFKVRVWGWEEICQRLVHSPKTLKQFYQEEDIINFLGSLDRKIDKLCDSNITEDEINEEEIIKAFKKSSTYLANWQQTLVVNNKWVDREQEELWFNNIHSQFYSSTILLGVPGTGKSALLARIAQKFLEQDEIVLGIKADKLSHSVNDFKTLGEYLHLPAPVDVCIKHIAKSKPVYIFLDQLDALSDLIDIKTSRLSVMLDLVHSLHETPNVHIFASSRPFEFNYDQRLEGIEANKLELPLLEWGIVEETLKSLDIIFNYMDDEFKEFLKRPSNLNFYLQYIQEHPQEVFKSHIELYEHMWSNSLGDNNDNRSKRLSLLTEMASEMTEDAKQELPIANFEEYIKDIDFLCSAGILTKSMDNKQIAFAHQTLQAFAWTRTIVKNNSLTEFVLSHQNNLNIRPKLNTAFIYLRDADPEEYKKQLHTLLIDNFDKLRKHILYLLIETIGGCPSPRDEEVFVISKLVQNEELFLKICQSVAIQPDWFDVLKNTHIEYWMNGSEIQRRGASIILSSCILEKNDDVMLLLERDWKNTKGINNLFHVLQDNVVWKEKSLSLAEFIVTSDDVSDYAASDISSLISFTDPALAPPVAAKFFLQKFENIEKHPIELPNLDEGDPSSIWRYNDAKSAPYEKLVDLENGWYNLSAISKASPCVFIESFWPFFNKVTEKLKREYLSRKTRYYDVSGIWFRLKEEKDLGGNYFVAALEDSIELFASQETDKFIEFVNREKASQFSPQHKLIICGLSEIVDTHTDYVLNYLLEDDRRFFLDVHHEGSYRCSISLISKLFSFLNYEQKQKLENKILTLNPYDIHEDDDVKSRKEVIGWNRGARFSFLRALPFNELTSDTAKFYKAEERKFGDRIKNPLTEKSHFGFMASKSPMNVEQMKKANVEDVVKCINEFKDSDRFDRLEFLSSGELCRTLGELAKSDYKKAIEIASKLPVSKSSPVEYVLRELPEELVGMNELQEIIKGFISLGFSFPDFYNSCANAIKKRIHKPEGLSDEWCEIIETWINKDGDKWTITDSRENDKQRKESLIWKNHGGYVVPQGNYTLIETISYGLILREEPQYSSWINFLERCLKINDTVRYWEYLQITLVSYYLSQCAQESAIGFLKKLHHQYPEIITGREFGIVLANAVHWMKEESINEWMNKIYSLNTPKVKQLFGEILGFRLVKNNGFEWCSEHYNRVLNNHETDVLIGLAYTFEKLWDYIEFRSSCSKYFIDLLKLKNNEVDEILLKIFYQEQHIDASPIFEAVFDELLNNGTFERSEGRFITRSITKLTRLLPDKVYKASQQMINGAGKDLGDIRTSAAADAPELVTIAITLHNLGASYQNKGLNLFEKLLELNAYKADEVLYAVDSRPRIINKQRAQRRR